MLRLIADDPEQDLAPFPKPLLSLAWSRVLRLDAASRIDPDFVVLDLAPGTDDAVLLQVIIGGLLSSTVLSRLVTPVMYKLLAPEISLEAEVTNMPAVVVG